MSTIAWEGITETLKDQRVFLIMLRAFPRLPYDFRSR